MSNYQSDRNFTDYVFNKLAKPIIYTEMNWSEYSVDKDFLEKVDLERGIDGYIRLPNDGVSTVQYRFRDSFYKDYNDVTLRYEREHNSNPNRRKSEFFKIEAEFLIYGITNGRKFSDKITTNTKFEKWAIIDINQLKKAIDDKKILIDPNLKSIQCELRNEIMICPVNQNKDNSSSFVPFSIPILKKVASNIIKISYGFDEDQKG